MDQRRRHLISVDESRRHDKVVEIKRQLDELDQSGEGSQIDNVHSLLFQNQLATVPEAKETEYAEKVPPCNNQMCSLRNMPQTVLFKLTDDAIFRSELERCPKEAKTELLCAATHMDSESAIPSRLIESLNATLGDLYNRRGRVLANIRFEAHATLSNKRQPVYDENVRVSRPSATRSTRASSS